MKSCNRFVLCLFALVAVAGCSSTKVTESHQYVTGKIARPNNIWVYDFIATPSDAPGDSDIAAQSTPQTAAQIEEGRKLGAMIAQALVADIQNMGLSAREATSRTRPAVGDIVIRGYLLSVDEGSAAKRVAIGFGSGASELTTAVEGYQMTAKGLRKLGSATVDSGGNKTPGGALGAAVLVATGNPVGLIVSSGVKVYGEASGNSKLEGRAKQTAAEISERLKLRFQEQGWIA